MCSLLIRQHPFIHAFEVQASVAVVELDRALSLSIRSKRQVAGFGFKLQEVCIRYLADDLIELILQFVLDHRLFDFVLHFQG